MSGNGYGGADRACRTEVQVVRDNRIGLGPRASAESIAIGVARQNGEFAVAVVHVKTEAGIGQAVLIGHWYVGELAGINQRAAHCIAHINVSA